MLVETVKGVPSRQSSTINIDSKQFAYSNGHSGKVRLVQDNFYTTCQRNIAYNEKEFVQRLVEIVRRVLSSQISIVNDTLPSFTGRSNYCDSFTRFR